jgi:hypothetical protein
MSIEMSKIEKFIILKNKIDWQVTIIPATKT